MNKRTVRRSLALLAVLAIAAIVWWMGWNKTPEQPPLTAREPAASLSPSPISTSAARAPVAATEAPAEEPVEPPIIEAVEVEKSEVCEGEENVVTVRARGRGRSGPMVRVKVGGKEGSRVPIRAYFDDRGQVDLPAVMAFVPGAPPVKASIPYFRVRPCDPRPIVEVRHQAVPNGDGEIEFFARVLAPDPSRERPRAMKPASATSFAWSFGDGTSEISTGPRVIHDYGSRRQDTAYSYFLVEVNVRLDEGRTATGHDTLDLQNLDHQYAQQGIALISPRFSPRFPTADMHGVVTQTVTLRHGSPEDVTITGVKRVMAYGGDVGSSPGEDVAPVSILGSTTIAAGRSLSFTVRLDPREKPEVLFETYDLVGHTTSGMQALGSFAVMRPPPDPTPSSGEAIESPALIARIERAQQRLSKKLVTMGDLMRLEQEGAFDDLPRAEEDGAR